MLIMLRAASEELDFEPFLAAIPPSLVEARWRRGEIQPPRKLPHADSGFNLLLAESDRDEEAISKAQDVLIRISAHLQGLATQGGELEIDVSLHVDAFASSSVLLTAEFLDVARRCQLPVRVSAYPCSD